MGLRRGWGRCAHVVLMHDAGTGRAAARLLVVPSERSAGADADARLLERSHRRGEARAGSDSAQQRRGVGRRLERVSSTSCSAESRRIASAGSTRSSRACRAEGDPGSPSVFRRAALADGNGCVGASGFAMLISVTEATPKPLVVIAGGGVAALEAVLALEALAGARVRMELLTPADEFVFRPLLVGEPFDRTEARRVALRELLAGRPVRHVRDGLAAVDAAARRVRTRAGPIAAMTRCWLRPVRAPPCRCRAR